jgi:hypothetical protein
MPAEHTGPDVSAGDFDLQVEEAGPMVADENPIYGRRLEGCKGV